MNEHILSTFRSLHLEQQLSAIAWRISMKKRSRRLQQSIENESSIRALRTLGKAGIYSVQFRGDWPELRVIVGKTELSAAFEAMTQVELLSA